MDFIGKLLLDGYTVLINTPHCGGGSGQTSIPIEERNDICSYMNSLLLKRCRELNVRCAGLHDIVVDPITRKNRKYFFHDKFHLNSPATKIGQYLQSTLVQRLLDQSELDKEFQADEDQINTVCNILISNIPGWLTIDRFLTNSYVQESKLILKDETYYQLIELPFPILIEKISLYFESQKTNSILSSSCQAIYESCDPMLLPEKNVFKGIPKETNNENNQSIKLEHDFSEHKFSNSHTRYIFISISNTKGTRLTKIGISRMRFSASN